MTKPRVGISQCLIGGEVRYDGGHKRNRFLVEALGPHVDYVPVCPEVEVGMPVPRPALRLFGAPERPRLVVTATGVDWTEQMERWAADRVGALAGADLDGYVLKKDSPSCGLDRVRLFRSADGGAPGRDGQGLFATALGRGLPALPLTEEGWLVDLRLRESFLDRLFSHHRLRSLLTTPTPAALVELHGAHKLLLMAHSPSAQHQLGALVARAGARDRDVAQVAREYVAGAVAALGVPTTPGKHANVLQHILGYFKDVMAAREKAEILALVDEYRAGVHPLAVPLTLLVHQLGRHELGGWLATQVYFEPFPRAIAAR